MTHKEAIENGPFAEAKKVYEKSISELVSLIPDGDGRIQAAFLIDKLSRFAVELSFLSKDEAGEIFKESTDKVIEEVVTKRKLTK